MTTKVLSTSSHRRFIIRSNLYHGKSRTKNWSGLILARMLVAGTAQNIQIAAGERRRAVEETSPSIDRQLKGDALGVVLLDGELDAIVDVDTELRRVVAGEGAEVPDLHRSTTAPRAGSGARD